MNPTEAMFPVQAAMWLLDRMDGARAWELSADLVFATAPDLEAMAAAFDAVVRRHPMLSLCFPCVGGLPVPTSCVSPRGWLYPYDIDGDEVDDACGWRSVSAGYYYTCGLDSTGTIQCWGDDTYGQASPPAGTFTAVSAGARHACGIDSTGAVQCWGWNEYGQTTPP